MLETIAKQYKNVTTKIELEPYDIKKASTYYNEAESEFGGSVILHFK